MEHTETAPRAGVVYVRTMWGEEIELDFRDDERDIGFRIQDVREALGGASRRVFLTARGSYLAAYAIGEVWGAATDE